MQLQSPSRLYSTQEYLALEESAECRHEYRDGEDGVLNLVSANCEIPHRQIYERAIFDS